MGFDYNVVGESNYAMLVNCSVTHLAWSNINSLGEVVGATNTIISSAVTQLFITFAYQHYNQPDITQPTKQPPQSFGALGSSMH